MTDKIIAEANHPIYPRATPETADGCAWVFYNKKTFAKYYYKLPPIGPNDIRIRSLYAGLCHSDTSSGRDEWGPQMNPLCPGHEIVGEIINVGSEVKKFKIGETVMFGPIRASCANCEWCKQGETALCPYTETDQKQIYGIYFGGWASHQQHPQSHCFKVPNGLDLKNAAPLMCAGLTTFAPIKRHLKKGQKIAVIGTGGLGHLAIQYAAKLGLVVDALVSGEKDKKNVDLMALGVHEIFYWKEKDVLKRLQLTYDAIVNTSSYQFTKDEMDQLLKTMKPRGKFLVLGIPPIDKPIQMSNFLLIFGEYEVIGSMCGGHKATEEMLEFSAKNKVECQCQHYVWEEFPKALADLEKGTPRFRAVVDVDGFSKNFGTKN